MSQIEASVIDAPDWETLVQAAESVSAANVAILLALPGAQERIGKLNKYDCIAVVHKLEIETEMECEDIDKEARLKLLFELQEVVQGVVEKLVKILDVHELLTSHVDRLMAPHMRSRKNTDEGSD
jgi:hypothetical protein